jgi:hypothetical protein
MTILAELEEERRAAPPEKFEEFDDEPKTPTAAP